MKIKLIVALGNPGKQYRDTRHNIAWQMIEKLSFFHQLSWKRRFRGRLAALPHPQTGETGAYLLKPQTYMNLSGVSVARALAFFKLTVADTLVIHDDLELDFGIIAFKAGDGLGGHNGLRSIAAHCGSRDFNRLRLGISRPVHSDVTSYVLGRFSAEQRNHLDRFLGKTAAILEENLAGGISELVAAYRKTDTLAD